MTKVDTMLFACALNVSKAENFKISPHRRKAFLCHRARNSSSILCSGWFSSSRSRTQSLLELTSFSPAIQQ